MLTATLNMLFVFVANPPCKRIAATCASDARFTKGTVDKLVDNLFDGLLDLSLKASPINKADLGSTALNQFVYNPSVARSRPVVLGTRTFPRNGWWAAHNRISRLRRASGVGDEHIEASASPPQFDVGTIKAQLNTFQEIALPFFADSRAGRQMFAGMIGLTLLDNGVSVVFSFIIRDFWSALSDKDVASFQSILAQFLAALVIAVPVTVYNTFQREQLAVMWRTWMTDRLLQLYSSNRVYYALERGREIDNPDQRITEDVKTFTSFSLNLFITVVTSGIDLLSFSAILYSIQPQLFGTLFAYALFGTITTVALGRKLVGLNYDKLQAEADFRYALVRIREYAESIAFYAGEDSEGKKVNSRLVSVIDTQKQINIAQRNLEFFTRAYQLLIQILPVAVVAPQYFSGKIPLGVISQSSEAFGAIFDDLSVIVREFETLSSFSAGVQRLSTFMKRMRDVDMGRPRDSAIMNLPNDTQGETISSFKEEDAILTHIELVERAPASGFTLHESSVLTVKNLSLSTPDRKRLLIKDLDLSLQIGNNLLIVGSSGAGKSSFLRAIAGLWTTGSGVIERLSDADTYFLPQRPYCSVGSLKEQLIYPNVEGSKTDEYPKGHVFGGLYVMKDIPCDQVLLDIFKAIDLEELPVRAGDGDPIEGLKTTLDWSNMLSLGEQQRLAFGRLLVNRPRLAILDEATSALDVPTEAKMYELLRDLSRSNDTGFTYISVGHRPTLLKYHDLRLQLKGDDNHRMDKIDASLLDSISDVQDI